MPPAAPLVTVDSPPGNWADLPLSAELLELITKAGYRAPTPVQTLSIPLVLEGHDVLVSSQTGSGKTASFVLPTVQRFQGKNGTYILALSPTREIAQQTGAVFETFGAPLGLKTVVCIGGASIPLEKEALASSPHIIVATPGRLCDHLERGNVWLDFIQCLIFDEADRMLDMGFSTQINMITDQLPKDRQTLMFSATFAPSVEKLARDVMKNPKSVTIGKSSTSVPKIDQRLLWMDEEKKLGALLRIMREEPGTIIVFSKSKEKVSQIWRSLHAKKIYEATYIHSDCTQEHREGAIADFKSGKFRVLIATDVAGRGIDVDDVAHVVNFDIPREAEDYVHRIGRTGRRGKEGIATSFAIPVRDEQLVRAIEKLLGIPSPEKPAPGEGSRERERERGPRGNGPRRDGGRGPRNDGPRGDRPPREARPDGDRGPRREGERGPRRDGPRAEGGTPRRDRGPRTDGPRGDGPRNDRPRNPERSQVVRPSAETASTAIVPPKKTGLVDRVLSWFKGG